ncbi:hypothetical protein, partial [Rhizobium leguminosarum]|uniref:hypothetical protein n=1 Tax=Rhizobium leguminosarum TaxID=384 RepID=UPI00197CE94C
GQIPHFDRCPVNVTVPSRLRNHPIPPAHSRSGLLKLKQTIVFAAEPRSHRTKAELAKALRA